MASTPRPATEWIYDDLGKMHFHGAYDFTSAEFDGRFLGIVFAYTDAEGDPQDCEKRFQLSMTPSLARALTTALLGHISRLPE